MEKSVLDWLEETARRYPERAAYEDPDGYITFGGLMDEAKRIGSAIMREKLSHKPVAVMMGRSVHTIAVFLGVVYSGHAYAPIDSTQPKARIDRLLELLDADAVITDNPDAFEGSGMKAIAYSDLACGDICGDDLKAARERMTEADPLYIIFTSGSSGVPKGVITSHHALMCYISAYAGMMGINKDDRLCAQAPLDYIAAVRDIYVPLLTGAYDYLCPKEYFMQPEALTGLLNEKEISCIGWSTSALGVLTKLGSFRDGSRPEHLKKICFSGSVMPGRVLREWQETLPDAVFVNQYGPTETTASCTYYRIDHKVEADELLPIGVPYDNYRVFLLSDDGREAACGELGEICVSGPALALGYYNDPERTTAAFIQNPVNHSFNELIYKTGDIGRYREDGLLEFHGRRDRQIKHMGHRVELDEIETAALAISGTGEAAALYDYDKEAIWLFYSGEAGNRELIVELRRVLPGFMVPRKVRAMEALPHLANGKVDMNKLKEYMS